MKIGKFGEGSDLQYQDTIEGSLFDIANRVIDLIYTKYLKAAITYEHDVRVETYPFPRDGIREAVYNALGHNNYADSVPIQIRIEDDAMYISNNCILPKDWTTETLMKPHKSMPFNPSIANAFYRAGYIEAWGRGIQKICEACQELGTPNPEYTVLGNDLTVKFTALESTKISDLKTPNRQNGGLNGGLEEETQIIYRKILEIIANDSKVTQKEIAQNSGIPLRTVQRVMKELTVRGQIHRQGGKRYGYWEITG